MIACDILVRKVRDELREKREHVLIGGWLGTSG
jgi:hypothetical protein